MSIQQLTILGSTGSIGCSTLDVVARHPLKYKIFALTAHTRELELFQQCQKFLPQYAVLGSEQSAAQLQLKLRSAGLATEVLWGSRGLIDVASHNKVDVVMAAIVGAAGLRSSLAAAEAGKKLLLANKEALVMAGQLFMDAVARGGCTLLPIDSEHNAIYQCLPGGQEIGKPTAGVRKILLTASGGPLRGKTLGQLKLVTPAEACAHPNWSMGQKISVDSATLMNKGLELIEACWLFGLNAKDIEVVVHPQSIIHSMVSYVDGSVLAQLGNPDMKTPIAYGLAWPERIDAGVAALDIIRTGRLDFEAMDETVFSSLALARQAWDAGGTAGAILNAANEAAVAAFLGCKISLPEICDINRTVLSAQAATAANDLNAIEEADQEARARALALISRSTFSNR